MVKSLFDICLSVVCQRSLCSDLALLPCDCKQKLLEFLASHDQISTKRCARLMARPMFGKNLTRIYFYLCDQLKDDVLDSLTYYNKNIRHISIRECHNISDQGIISATKNQVHLRTLELIGLPQISSQSLVSVKSRSLTSVDLSGCVRITSIFRLVCNNPEIRHLCLNGCKNLDEQALYDIARGIGPNLASLYLDHLYNSRMSKKTAAIYNLSVKCPNMNILSLSRFFGWDQIEDELEFSSSEEFRIEGKCLQELDLYGNFFSTLPYLPPTIVLLRLSVTGQENVFDLIQQLAKQRQLISIHLQVSCYEEDTNSIDTANRFLCALISCMGTKITRLHIAVQRLYDTTLHLITQEIPNLTHLALDVLYLNSNYLHRLFIGGVHSHGSKLRSLRLCRMRISYRALFAIGRWAKSLSDLEMSYMSCVDDRFLALLAKNCGMLKSINFNGCKWVTDAGLQALAKKCLLREVRIRGTACTDKSIYTLAQFCPDLEWIAHADFSGKPKISDQALMCLRNACIQRVIC